MTVYTIYPIFFLGSGEIVGRLDRCGDKKLCPYFVLAETLPSLFFHSQIWVPAAREICRVRHGDSGSD